MFVLLVIFLSIRSLHEFLFFKKFLAMPHDMWDLSSLTRDQTCAPCIGSADSKPLDDQGSPSSCILEWQIIDLSEGNIYFLTYFALFSLSFTLSALSSLTRPYEATSRNVLGLSVDK